MRRCFSHVDIFFFLAFVWVPALYAETRKPIEVSPTLKRWFEGEVRAEWDAFKQKDKRGYGRLLDDDFVAIEDDGQGMRNKVAAMNEVDRSVVNGYKLFAVTVTPLAANVVLVSYEVTLQFPP